MRGTTALLPAKHKFNKLCPMAVSRVTVATSTPRTGENNDSKEGGSVRDDKNEPIVVFSKSPPRPSVLGPLIALSLLETWTRREGDDN